MTFTFDIPTIRAEVLRREEAVRIGIPRGLLFYHYFPMWMAFFEELGAEVVVSPPTTEEMVSLGCSRVIGDVCLPVKVFCGHAFSLKDRCDYLFIPAAHSTRRELYNCPKFIGLPDLVRATVPECPPIIDPDLDINKGRQYLYETAYKLGFLMERTTSDVESALGKALDAHRLYGLRMQRRGLRSPQAIAEVFPQFYGENGYHDLEPAASGSTMTVALIGHRYLLYDQHLNYRLFHRLRSIGVNIVTAETMDRGKLTDSMLDIVEGPYWGYEDEVVGAGAYYLRSDVDGIISVVAFGCGPDSMMIELLQRRAKHIGKPYLNLVLDEHSSEGGLVTRIEAFVDMVRRTQHRQRKKVYINRRDGQEKESIDALGIPNMGEISAAFKTAAKLVDIDLIVPTITKHTISLGVRYSPEQACLPFKAILGAFVECLEQGADTLFMVTSSNACRMGYYSKVHEEILRDLGYKFKFLRHRPEDKGLLGVLRTIRRCTNHASWRKVVEAYILGTAKLKALDDLHRKAAKVRAVELQRGQTDQVYQAGVEAIDEALSLLKLKRVEHQYQRELNRVAIDTAAVPLKVGIVGEMYVVVEPYVNLNLEVELGKLGVETQRNKTTYISEWTSLKSYMGVLTAEKQRLAKYAYPHLRRDVGGHGLESVAEKVRLAREGYDGIVHVAPFTCMPESIAQNVMPRTEENIPVLTVLCDEQATQTGLLTRLEAFVDLLERRRRDNGGVAAMQ
ncbi:MAG TPA: hypothetical protein G4O13_05740 [Dehalococcoidia bacterium]|nr:hypothetical protein [Dehalococcoidia bacterium]